MVEAIRSEQKSYKSADTKNKEFKSDVSSEGEYTGDSSDDDYMDLESIINEHNVKIAALEERMTKLESSQHSTE